MLLNSADAPSVIGSSQEIAAYEAIWTRCSTVAKVARLFRQFYHALLSQVAKEIRISEQEIESVRFVVAAMLPFDQFASVLYGESDYPKRLQDAKHPVEALYYQGALNLLCSKSVAVLGARQATEAGLHRTRRLARFLVEHGFTVMSGLAQGIDTAAHTAALEASGRTIAVTGTPLNVVYPRENLQLQRHIAQNHLLISQVPFYLYSRQDYRKNRFFFLERNKTMSVLSDATVIVEASDRSGTLTQAEAAIQQGRKVFMLNSCFERGLDCPERFRARGQSEW
ncbi:MAG TPA: DNA-processing protein DprA [Allocoleopsis sp.]